MVRMLRSGPQRSLKREGVKEDLERLSRISGAESVSRDGDVR